MIVFHQLTTDQIVEMVDLMINRVATQLKNKDMGIELDDLAKKLLATRGFDPVLGARPLRRTIQREIEDQLSEDILNSKYGPGQIVHVSVEGWDGEGTGDKASFKFSPKAKLTKDSVERKEDEGKEDEVVLTGAAEGPADAASGE